MQTAFSSRWLVVMLFAFGCGSEQSSELGLEIVGPAGELPASLRAIVSVPGVARQSLDCPSGEGDGKLRCGERGLVLGHVSAGSIVTLKAPGYAFRTLELEAGDLERSSLRITLHALPEFAATDDYDSGFEAETGEARFLELAIASDTELGPARSVKFYVSDLSGAPVVYFQNTRRHPLHYDFAHLVLGVAASREEFARTTYSGEARNALAGTLTYYPELVYLDAVAAQELKAPIALEFFPGDDLSPRLALLAHRLLEERLSWLPLRGSERRLVYLPAGSLQERALAEQHESFFAADAGFANHVDFYSGVTQQVLNPGVAYGSLRLLDPDELAHSVVSFRDIALLTRLPNDVPLVGGTLTEELQTPLAHVNLAARARGTPNLALRSASSDPRVAPFLDRLVRFEVTAAGFSLAETTLAEAEQFWESLARERVVPQADLTFEGLPGFEELHFGDFVRVGSKAANLAELRRLLGEQAPDGFAVPFSAYAQFLANNRLEPAACTSARTDCEADGRASELCTRSEQLCLTGAEEQLSVDEFLDHLLANDDFKSESALREACLDAVRFLIEHGTLDADFGAALDARVAERFGSAQVRLRSSTNGEDLPGFSGAGLYESVSARASGNERASERIRSVWASVWSWRAFEERQFWNVDHRGLKMAIAVNLAIDHEAANGVLITQNLQRPGSLGHYVNVQYGEIEVTNPAGGALPEVFSIVPTANGEVEVVRQRFSSLFPEEALLSDREVLELSQAADRVETRFAELYQKPPRELSLDLEFKLYGPERRLLIKQARPYASASSLP
jgi:pyruvate, water dikinase